MRMTGPAGREDRPAGPARFRPWRWVVGLVAVAVAALLVVELRGGRVSGRIPLTLVGSAELPAPPGERVREVRFADPEGGEVVGVLREPAPTPDAPMAAVILVAGRETGREAATVIEGPVREVVLALEYPAALPETFSADAVRALPRIRGTALRMPGLLRGAAAWLAEQERVDAGRMLLVGVSYGVPFAAAAAVDTLFAGVALHHGGADLALLLRQNLAVESPFLRALAAELGAWYFRALEPARYVGRVAPRPLLLVNATHDELVPRESALGLLDAARPPVRQIWLPYGHLMPGDVHQMEELADSTLAHFPFVRP